MQISYKRFYVKSIIKKPMKVSLFSSGYVPPFDFEAMYYDKINPLGQVA